MKSKILIILLALTMALPGFFGTLSAQGFRNSPRSGGGTRQSAPAQRMQSAPRPSPTPQRMQRSQPVQRPQRVERPRPVQRDVRPAQRPQPQVRPSGQPNNFRPTPPKARPGMQTRPNVQNRPTVQQAKPVVRPKPVTPPDNRPQQARPVQPGSARPPKQDMHNRPEVRPSAPGGRPQQIRPAQRPSVVQRPAPMPGKPSVRPMPQRPNRPPIVKPGDGKKPVVIHPNRAGGRPPIVRPGGQRPPHMGRPPMHRPPNMGRPPIHRPPAMHPRPPFRPPHRPPYRPPYRPWHRPSGWNVFIGSGSFYVGYGWGSSWWYRPAWYYPSTTVIVSESRPEPAVINNYYVEQSPALRNYNFYEGIKYNPIVANPGQKLDVYAPISRTIGGSPCVVLIPDGEWDGNYEKDLASAAEYLVSKGYLCVSVSYRKYPDSKIKDSVEDVMRALYWVKNNAVKYGGDPKRIGVVGVGGGGYLAEMLAVKSTQSRPGDVNPVLGSVSAVVAIASPSDVYNYGVLVGSGDIENDLGSDSSKQGVFEGGLADFSPLSQTNSYTPPILLIHADGDDIVPYELSERMKAESDARSAKVELNTIDSDEHRIWMAPDGSDGISKPVWNEVSAFFGNKMRLK